MQPLLISIFLLHCHCCLASQVSTLNTLYQGHILNSTSQLVSGNEIFKLEFYTPQNTNNTYLAVRGYTSFPPFDFVWTPDWPYPMWIGNRDNPVHPSSNPILTIDETGNLIINHTGGEPVPVYSSVLIRNKVSATLLDSGNFVVSEMGSSILWESFDYPTDTLMPGMKLGFNRRTRRNWKITSWFNETNASAGAFTMEWDPIVAQLLIRRRGVPYWMSGEMKYFDDDDSNNTFRGFEIFEKPSVFGFNFNFTNVTNGGGDQYLSFTQISNHVNPVGYYVAGLRLIYDGSINDTRRGLLTHPISNCYGYETKRSPLTQGCQLWNQPSCRNNRQMFVRRSGSFALLDFKKQQMPGGFSVLADDHNSSSSPSDCREVCWNDCECLAYNYESDGCKFVRGTNVKFEQNLDGTASPMYIIITAPSASKGMKKSVEIILGVLSAMVVLSLGTTFFILQKLQLRKREAELHQILTLDGCTDDNGRGSTNHDLTLFTYSSIKSATHNFSPHNKLGQGGFGPVYKGKTSEGKDIAVKLLSRQSGQGLLEFKTELILISKLQHVNLVKLIGFCVHKDDKMIIYDYMPNKSLDFFLFSPSDEGKLDWPKRFSIIEGIAQGLLYLHKYSRLKIIHRDLKPSNILLDQNMIPKISDFGLARIFKQDISEANTHRRVGTIGYMAPEYAMQGIFSVKSDVYSFGVLILEIVSGRKNNSFHDIEGPLSLVEYAWELWKKEHVLELMDPTLRDSCVIDQLQRCIHIGLLCVENHAVDRPTIEDVISMLKNEMTNLPMPKCPAFITRNSVIEVDHCVPEKLSSANEITLSEIGGR